MKGHNNTLKYILENGILSKATIEENIEMDDALYLKMHTNEVWQGKDGNFSNFLISKNNQ